ncbi:transcriptional regulator [Fusibacter ferrireducens]|uniref:Histidine kinase N-terminal 7TM region domain-containing protein n=1 Tax=Fusibacter ferrireducens TaxID=2785058 RepID=A0ABR9ZTD4_9FIRM|nr:hypothetical protein [Fusibacter ferrireducens]MBF4693717.1 hypothetical protein [Fusibacter ferrireducens]
MSDGRYYTYYQFFNIVLVTFLTMFVVASVTYSYYRLSDKQNKRYAYILFSLITIFAILHTIEGVMPNLILARTLRNSESTILIVLMSYYVLEAIFIWWGALFKGKISKSLKILLTGIYWGGILILWMSDLILEDYMFHQATYSILYKIIVLALLMVYIISSVSKMMVQMRDLGPNPKGGNEVIAMMLKIFFLSPLLIYTLALFKNSTRLDFFEIMIGFGYVFFLNLELYTQDESGVTMHVFDKMGDMSLDCIFVVDKVGKILYKNNSSQNSSFFKSTEGMKMTQVQDLFNDEIVIKSNHLGREYIVLKHNDQKHNDQKHYFAFKTGELKDASKVIGKIITITEITELINLLHVLEERREVSKAVNQRLKKHALVVYRLEKEKEISALLEEIINSRETQMNVLSQMIDRTKRNIDTPFFETYIEDSIKKSNTILEDVRKTVSNYRAYYGEALLTEATTGRYK